MSLCELSVVGRDRASVAGGAEVLRRIEAERRERPRGLRRAALVAGPMRLAGILHEGKAVPPAQVLKGSMSAGWPYR